MGDVLPPKRQTVVERLKRRFELYRRHQNACLPRYEEAAHGLYDSQRQDTLLLKQRFLESKAKKAKSKSDHHRTYKESTVDASKSQLHSKPLKRSADDALASNTAETANNDDSEKPAKMPRMENAPDKTQILELPPQQPNQQPGLPAFSVQIVQQFSQSPLNQSSQTIQTNVTVQPLNKPLNSPIPQTSQSVTTSQKVQESSKSINTSQDENLQSTSAMRNIVSGTNNIECKQEKDIVESDLCQFKNSQASNNSGSSGGDRLSDTFPSIEFTDESGENVLHPDILNDLIEDVFTNPTDIMTDFNFEDSVESMKDQEDPAKDLMDLVKGTSPTQQRSFSSNNLPFVNTSNNQHQQNGLFRSITKHEIDVMGEVPITSISPSTLTSTTTLYNSPSQRLPSYGNSLSLPNGLGLDFKMNEPSPAALTLKQMAEQHQNMQQKQQQQQQQLVNSTLNSRTNFNQDAFTSHMNPLRSSNYLNGSNSVVQNSSPKIPNSGTNIFNSFDQHMSNFSGAEVLNNFPSNCEPVSPNNMFESELHSRTSAAMNETNLRGLQLKLSNHPLEQQKPPAYNSTRPLTHYSDSATVRHQNSANTQQQQHPVGRQFQSNSSVRLQMPQVPQMQNRQRNTQQVQQDSHEQKQQQHNIMPNSNMPHHSNMYGSYSSQQPVANQAFHVSMSQSLTYSSAFPTNPTINRPPPEYKAPHHRNVVSENLRLVEQLNAPSQVMFNQTAKNKYTKQQQQRPPNVTITPDGSAISSSHDWRSNVINNQPQQNQFRVGSFASQENYRDLNSNIPPTTNIPLPSIYNQYRMPANQIPTNRMTRPNISPQNHMMVQHRQRLVMPQRPRNPSMTSLEPHSSMTVNNNVISSNNVMGPMYSEHQEITRQDGSHINLDFLDNIESSASDLLNFDQVMQGPPFPILDDIDILGK